MTFSLRAAKPRNRRQFLTTSKRGVLKHRQYRNDINSYIYDLRQLFGAKESFSPFLPRESPFPHHGPAAIRLRLYP